MWNAFWSGGISNPLEVIEQITYLLFLPRLDEAQVRMPAGTVLGTVKWAQTILQETDGPMLKHGLQEIAGARIIVPNAARQQPRDDFLAERYELFRKAS